MTYRLFEINKGGVIILSCLTNLETCKELRAKTAFMSSALVLRVVLSQ